MNYFTDPLDEDRLAKLLKKAKLKPFEVLRRREKAFKELNLSPETPDAEVIRAIVANPNLLERPIVEVGREAVLARPIEKGIDLIKKAG